MRSFWLSAHVAPISNFVWRLSVHGNPERGERVCLYLPADEARPLELQAFGAVMEHLRRSDSPLPLLGYSIFRVSGGFRQTVEETVEPDETRCIVLENWKPASMTMPEFLLQLKLLQAFIEGAYAGAGCPQKKVLVTHEPGAIQL